jgi:hypothetical protein
MTNPTILNPVAAPIDAKEKENTVVDVNQDNVGTGEVLTSKVSFPSSFHIAKKTYMHLQRPQRVAALNNPFIGKGGGSSPLAGDISNTVAAVSSRRDPARKVGPVRVSNARPAPIASSSSLGKRAHQATLSNAHASSSKKAKFGLNSSPTPSILHSNNSHSVINPSNASTAPVLSRNSSNATVLTSTTDACQYPHKSESSVDTIDSAPKVTVDLTSEESFAADEDPEDSDIEEEGGMDAAALAAMDYSVSGAGWVV